MYGSKEYTNIRRNRTIYESVSQQEGIHVNEGGFLGAVGGFNQQNYDLRLNLAKGRAYSESQCVNDISINNININNTNQDCITAISSCAPLTITSELREGSFLSKNPNTNLDNKCSSNLFKQLSLYDLNLNYSTASFNNLVNYDKLQNLNLNSKLPLTCNHMT